MAFLQRDDVGSLTGFFSKCCEEIQSLSGQLTEQIHKLKASGQPLADDTDKLFKELEMNCREVVRVRNAFMIPYIHYLLDCKSCNTNTETTGAIYPADYPMILDDKLSRHPLKNIFSDVNRLIDKTEYETNYPQSMSILRWLLTLLLSQATQMHFLEKTYLKPWIAQYNK